MENIKETENILNNYESYRRFVLEESLLFLSDKKRYIQTDSIGTETKISSINQMIDFFYLEEEDLIVEDLEKLKNAILIKHILKVHR